MEGYTLGGRNPIAAPDCLMLAEVGRRRGFGRFGGLGRYLVREQVILNLHRGLAVVRVLIKHRSSGSPGNLIPLGNDGLSVFTISGGTEKRAHHPPSGIVQGQPILSRADSVFIGFVVFVVHHQDQ